MDSELHKSIKRGDLTEVQRLLKKGAGINSLFGMRGTPLCAAIYEKQSHIVDYLLQSGCDVNAKDFDGEPPLCLSIRMEVYDLAEKLISQKQCDVNKQDPISGQKPIHIAVSKKNFEQVVSLVKHGCDINAKDSKGNTALHLAIKYLETGIAKYLIDSGCDICACDYNGEMAIHECVTSNDMTTLQYLLSMRYLDGDKLHTNCGANKYIDIKTKGFCDTALLLAVKNENVDAVCTLIKQKCDLETSNSFDETPLFLACKFNRSDIAICLLEAGACPNILSKRKKEFHVHTDLHQAAPIHEAISLGNLHLVKILIDHGADINIQDSVGQTPLFIALHKNKSVIADYLLNEGSNVGLDVNIVTLHRKNLLFAVASCTNPAEFAQRLIRLGCDVNNELKPTSKESPTVCSFPSPLEHAVEMGCIPLIEVLLQNGARIDTRKVGDSLLHLCALADLTDVAATLIQWGADIYAQSDNTGCSSPLSCAIFMENYEFAKLFLAFGCKVEEGLKEHMYKVVESEEDILDDDDIKIVEETLKMAENPLRLKNLCRFQILDSIKSANRSVTKCLSLPLPKDLINYLRFQELDPFKYMTI